MTIHQAKGLEFPLVIVDVASDYATNHLKQRFRRFPENPSSVQNVEDDLAPFCQIGPPPPDPNQLAAFVRRPNSPVLRGIQAAPECVLMLVGVDPCLRYKTTIRHVATGWRR